MTSHSQYLDGFFDDTTIKALRQAEGCTHSRIGSYPITNTSRPLTGTMWYDITTGTIHSFGNGKPYRLRADKNTVPAIVLFDEKDHEPLPQVYTFFNQETAPALKTALASIRQYNEHKEIDDLIDDMRLS
ncbi:MAG: hypothetical protein Q8R47_01620 [Nanoarchaeota archaeon]|nr:hypothetical protein [Nanoarchaeota archaeon]